MCVFTFLLCLLLLFSQVFVRPPQTAILPFCISFSWEWSWSLPPVQCHEPPFIVLQAPCLSNLIPWICRTWSNRRWQEWALRLHPHHGIKLTKEEKWTTDIGRNWMGLQVIMLSEKVNLKGLHNCKIYITFLKWQNHRDKGQISSFRALGGGKEGRWRGNKRPAWGSLVMELFTSYQRWRHTATHVLKLCTSTHTRAEPRNLWHLKRSMVPSVSFSGCEIVL